jgi:general secretion pathway protein G
MKSTQDLVRDDNSLRYFKAIFLLMVVAICVYSFGGYLFSSQGSPREKTITQLTALQETLSSFKQQCGNFPKTAEGLEALLLASGKSPPCYHQAGFSFGELPRDAWGNQFLYSSDGLRYSLKSLGRDGKEGGQGEDADIVFKGKP